MSHKIFGIFEHTVMNIVENRIGGFFNNQQEECTDIKVFKCIGTIYFVY